MVNCEEFTDSGGELGCLVAKVLESFEFVFVLLVGHDISIVEVEQAPLDLVNCELRLVVPDCNGSGILFIKESTKLKDGQREKSEVLTQWSHTSRRRGGSPCRSWTGLWVSSFQSCPFWSGLDLDSSCLL